MNKGQGYGIIERAIYGVVLMVAMKFVAWGYLDAEMAPYVAAGGVALVGGVYAWWRERPVAVLNRAGNAVPENATLVITTPENASPTEKAQVRALALSASDKVLAKT